MRLIFPNLTAVLFDALFDVARSTSDSHKADNDALDIEVDDPLRHITVPVNDAILAVGMRAASQVRTYGDNALYDEERIYRAYVAMERARRIQEVAIPRSVRNDDAG